VKKYFTNGPCDLKRVANRRRTFFNANGQYDIDVCFWEGKSL